jgi:hypothetical protein
MLQLLVGVVFLLLGIMFVYQSVAMLRAGDLKRVPRERAIVVASRLLDDGVPTDPSRMHYRVELEVVLEDGSRGERRVGRGSRHEAEALPARVALGKRVSVRRTGFADPAVLLDGERLEPGMRAGFGALAFAVGLTLLWLAGRDWRAILALA